MRRTIALAFLVAAASWVAGVGQAAAQENIFSSPSVDFYINRSRNQDIPQVGLEDTVRRDINRGRVGGRSTYTPGFLQGAGGGGGTAMPVQKPFANATHRPTVSPYLNLLREDLTDEVVPNYHTLVRPQLQQIEFQQQQQQQNAMMYRQLQQLQARSAFTPQGSETMLPTGHMTTFLNLGGYYPMPGRRR